MKEDVQDINRNDDAELFGDISDERVPVNLEDAFYSLSVKLQSYSNKENDESYKAIISDKKPSLFLSELLAAYQSANIMMSSIPIAIPITLVLPTQFDIYLNDSMLHVLYQDCSVYFSKPTTIIAPIITYRKTFIIDGNKRWSQVIMINPNATITAINYNVNSTSPFRVMARFRDAKSVLQDNQTKINNSDSVFEKPESAIKAYIDKHMQDVCWKSLVKVGVCNNRDSAINYITKNTLALKKYNPPYR